MPRNIAGVYTLPAIINPVVPATPIATTWANPTLQDIAQALTDSISRTGNTTITANLKMSGFKHTGAGNASAEGEYVTWNQTGVKFPAMGIGVDSFSWESAFAATDMAGGGAVASASAFAALAFNTYGNSGVYKAKATGKAGLVLVNSSGEFIFYNMASVAAGATQTLVARIVGNEVGDLTITGQYNGSGAGLTGNAPSLNAGGLTWSNVAFNARSSSTFSSDEARSFGAIDFNDGSAFDNSTGRFTAPVTGLYEFTAVVSCTVTSAINATAYFQINGGGTTYGQVTAPNPSTGSWTHEMTVTVVLPLTAGQYVSLFVVPVGASTRVVRSFNGARLK